MPNDIDYRPPPTLRRFMNDDSRVRIVRGPVGSGKSSAMVMELLKRAAQQAPDPKDGIRRTRGVIVRNTMPQLESTSLKTVNELLRPIIDYRAGDKTVWIKQGDIEAEWILMPLDRPENVQRLLSLDLTYAWLSELRELPVQIMMDVLSRCGRFPSKMHGGPTWHGVIGETNSFSEDSEWNKVLEEGILFDRPTPPTWGYFVQPGARDPGAENRENLVANYYEDLILNNSEAWVEQYVDNIVAPSLSGEAVFRASFRATGFGGVPWHVAAQPIPTIPGRMVIVGMDFGRHPVAILGQMDPNGRIVVTDEVVYSETMGVEKFIGTQLRPLLAQPNYQRLPVGVCGDPSGVSRGQIGEESVFMAMKRLGLSAQPAQTNNIDPRLRAVEKAFLGSRNAGPAIMISPTCKMLIQALRSKYRYDKKKDGELAPAPSKSHPWSDLADAFQYMVLGFSGNIMARLNRTRRDSSARPAVSSQGWT